MAVVTLTLPAYSIPPLSLHATDPKTLLLEHCKSRRDLRQVHARLIKTGSAAADPSAIENLLESAALVVPDALDYALAVFRRSPAHLLRSQSYNILVRAFIRSRSPDDALLLFLRMLARSVPPDPHTFSCILKACSRMNSVPHGRMVHARILKCGLGTDDFVRNSLIHMYASCGEVGVARALFDRMPDRGIVTWNAMFAGYFKAGAWAEVVELFRYMSELGAAFDDVTLISVLTACGRLGVLDLGERIDEYVERNTLKSNQNLVTSLVDMYAKCGKVGRARKLFDEMPYRDVVAWSAMISGYTQSDQCR